MTTPHDSYAYQPPRSRSMPDGLLYHQVHRGGAWGAHAWWRGLVGLLSLVVLVLIAQVVVLIGLTVWYLAGGLSLDQAESRMTGDPVTPGFLLAVNLGWALAIPLTWLAVRTLHGLRPRWLASVMPRIRWHWLAVCLGLSVVALIATVVVSLALPETAGTETSGTLNDFTSTTRDYLLIVLLLTPLQAAGEEYAFRGYLTQAVGGWFSNPRVSVTVAIVVPSVIFAVAHGVGQDAPIFFDRLAFGIVAGVLAILTGGLEAGIAMHVLNNWLAFGVALAYGDMDSALNPSGGNWWSIPVTLTQSLVYLGLAVFVARRMGIQNRTGPGILEGSRRRV
jgi:membrane protease YdiL (CAAX protease family)